MNVALLIDCENANPESIDGILGELAEKGAINIRRAYGNWKNQAGWEEKLHPFAIQPVQQFAYTKGKNAVDMCMAIDAMDLLFIHTDRFGRPSDESRGSPGAGERRSRKELRGDTELSNLLRSAVEAMKG